MISLKKVRIALMDHIRKVEHNPAEKRLLLQAYDLAGILESYDAHKNEKLIVAWMKLQNRIYSVANGVLEKIWRLFSRINRLPLQFFGRIFQRIEGRQGAPAIEKEITKNETIEDLYELIEIASPRFAHLVNRAHDEWLLTSLLAGRDHAVREYVIEYVTARIGSCGSLCPPIRSRPLGLLMAERDSSLRRSDSESVKISLALGEP